MNNEELQRKYEISLWTLQDSFITVLKPSGLKWEGQGLDPHLVIRDDGDRALSFKIPMYLRRNGQFVENPIWHNTRNGVLMVNLRKLKVIFNKGTEDEAVFELVITKVTESHEGFEKYCEVEAEGLAFHELGKQGYTITLSGQADVDFEYPEGEYENNINFWCDRVLKNSMWTYSVQMDWSSEDGVIDDISKPYGQLTQEERDELNAAREAKGLRRRDKIYEDSYVSSWKYDANRDAVVPTETIDQKEKFRLVEGSESNRYNLTQSIAEIFQVYCKYKYYYDENYHIIGREVIFYNNFLQDGGEVLDFTYHYNTQSISREMDGTDLVSKMYVKSLVDADSPTGEVNLDEASANKSLENYLLNFDYLYSIGTITEEQYNSIDEYEKKIRIINEEMMSLQDAINTIGAELPKLEAQKATLGGDEESGTIGSIQLADENLANANAFLNSLTSSDGDNDGYITIGEDTPQILFLLKGTATQTYSTPARGRGTGSSSQASARIPSRTVVVEGNDRCYFANVSTLGIKGSSIKLYKNWDSSQESGQKLTGQIKGFNKVTDEFGNIKKIVNLPEIEGGKCYAIFKYKPQTEYENIIRVYEKKKATDQALLNEITETIETKEAELENYNAQLEVKKDEKQLIMNAFEALMGPALREGMWQPEDDYIKFGDRHSDRVTIKKENSDLSSTELISFGWDTKRFGDYEGDNYYKEGVNLTPHYYPCINLSKSIQWTYSNPDDTEKATIYNQMLARLNGNSKRKIKKDKNYLNSFSLSYVNASEEAISDGGEIQYREYLTIGSGLEFAYLREKTTKKVIPVLMLTASDTITGGSDDDEKILNVDGEEVAVPDNLYDIVKHRARLGVVTVKYEEGDTDVTISQRSPINLFKTVTKNGKRKAQPLNVWIPAKDLPNYERVFPRIKIKSRYLKISQDNLKVRPRGADEALQENYDYYLLPDGDSYYITLKPENFFKYSTQTFSNSGKSYDISYTISNTALAVYLDAVKVLKESAYPKVSYQIDPSIVNENFFYNAYNRLNQLAHINDYELKFENVMGYISEIDLDLDKPWEDKVTVKNYKSKFEDLFSTIVAETEQMKKNAYVTDLVTSAISNKGELTPEVFAKALTSAEVSIPMMRVFNDNQLLLASQMSASAAANMASLANTTAFRVMTGDTGLAFQGGVIDDIQVNKVYGLVIQGHLSDSQEDPKNTFFRVDNDQMGFFRGTYNDPNKQWEPLLYFENGDLALSGNIYAKNGWFGGERGWIIGEGSIANNDYTIGEQTIHDFGGLLYSYNGKVIFSTGNENSQNDEEKLPHIILYKGGFTRNSSGEITGLSNDPVFLFDGENLAIEGKVTATSGQIGGWNITSTQLSSTQNYTINGVTDKYTSGLRSSVSGTGTYLLAIGSKGDAGVGNWSYAPFRVTKEGKLYATDAIITGAITATSLTIQDGSSSSPIQEYVQSQVTAGGGNRTYTGKSMPSSPKNGDLFIPSSDFTHNSIKYISGYTYRYNGSSWIAVAGKKITGTVFSVDTESGKITMAAGETIDIASNNGITLGTNTGMINITGSKGVSISSDSKITLFGGQFIVNGDNFKIDSDGNVTMSGKVTATSGSIGAWSIGSSSASSYLQNSIYALETIPDSSDTGEDSSIFPANTKVLHRWSANSTHKWKLAIGVPVTVNNNTTTYSFEDAAFKIRRDGKVYMDSAVISGKTTINTTGKINLTGSEIKLRSSATGAKSYFRFGAYEGSGTTDKGADSESSTTSSGFLRIRVDGEDPAVYSFDKNYSYIEMSRSHTSLSLTESTETLGIASIGLWKKYNDYLTAASGVKGEIMALSDSIFLQSRDFISVESPFILLRGAKSNSNLYRIIIYHNKTNVSGSFDDIDVTGYYADDFNGNLTGNILIQIPNDYTNVSEWTECKVYYRTNPDYLPHE